TVCPYYLDGDLAQRGVATPRGPYGARRGGSVTEGPVIPDEPASRGELVSAAAYRWRLTWLLCSFQGPWRGVNAGRPPRALWSRRQFDASSRIPAGAGLSKLNSMLA